MPPGHSITSFAGSSAVSSSASSKRPADHPLPRHFLPGRSANISSWDNHAQPEPIPSPQGRPRPGVPGKATVPLIFSHKIKMLSPSLPVAVTPWGARGTVAARPARRVVRYIIAKGYRLLLTWHLQRGPGRQGNGLTIAVGDSHEFFYSRCQVILTRGDSNDDDFSRNEPGGGLQ